LCLCGIAAAPFSIAAILAKRLATNAKIEPALLLSLLPMLLRLLFAPITGLTWIAEQIQERVDAEMNVKENLQKQLLTLQLAFDMGDIEEAEFEAQEEALLLALQEIADQERAAQAAIEEEG